MIREPLIRRSTFWADVINLLGGRRLYREPAERILYEVEVKPIDIYKRACTCSGGVCKGDRCLYCGAFDDPCPQTGASGPLGRWEGNPVTPKGDNEV